MNFLRTDITRIKGLTGLLAAAAATLSLVLLASCTHKELSDGVISTVRVRVSFDWQLAPDAAPLGMAVFFYNADTGDVRRFDMPGTKGGFVDLPMGNWHAMSFNNDTEGVMFAGQDAYHEHYIYTRDGNILEPALGNGLPVPPRAGDTEEEPVVITPDMMWGHAFTDHNVSLAKGETEHNVGFTPEELMCHYDFEIRNVDGLAHVEKMCAAISGMSGGMKVHSGELDATAVTLPLSADKLDGTTIGGKFLTFGHHGANAKSHKMTLYVWMDDGRKLAYGTESSARFDVTDQVDNAPDPRNVHIVIDGLDLPVAMEDGMFRPSADDWQTEHHDIEI